MIRVRLIHKTGSLYAMDEAALIDSLNNHLITEDGAPISPASSLFTTVLRDSLMLHNQSYADLMVQAYVGRYFMRSGERVVVSLANKRIRRRQMYAEIRHTLLEMMLVVAMATLAYVLVKMDSS